MDPRLSIETFGVTLAGGITLACRAAGAAGQRPTVLLLHGFPEAAFAWDDVITRLAPSARCVAPQLRGYAGSSAPGDVSAYRSAALVGDLAALVETLGAPVDLVVAHDWGGMLAWELAAQQPQLLQRLLVINAPHPAAFLRELRHNPAQQAASAYITFLCRPDAEALLAEQGFRRLWRFFGDAAWLTPALRVQYEAAWSAGLRGPLNYYRASPLRPAVGPDDALHTLLLPDGAVRVPLPTTLLWGDADVALLPGLLDGLQDWVPQLQLRRVPGASHWIVHEQPALVAAQILAALR